MTKLDRVAMGWFEKARDGLPIRPFEIDEWSRIVDPKVWYDKLEEELRVKKDSAVFRAAVSHVVQLYRKFGIETGGGKND